MYTIFTALDLELNQPSGRIIQIGAVVGDISTGKILDRFSLHINPGEDLHEDIIELTGIHQGDVDNAVSLREGYAKLCDFHKQHGSFMNPITWGGSDAADMKRQLQEDYGEYSTINWPFGRRWIDVKTIWVSHRIANGQQIQGGLSKSMSKVGLSFKGRQHDAQDDAENTFHMYCAMLKLLKKAE